MPTTLAYWNVQGLAEPIRILLEYVGESYEDKRYEIGSTPETLRKEWLEVKYKLGLDFPNLPYYIDGKVRLTQSGAILRYVARKHKLLGSTAKDQIRTDMCEQQFVDFRTALAGLAFGGNYENGREAYVKALPDKLREFDAFLGGKFHWFGGSKISFVDFLAYSVLYMHRLFEPQCLETFEHLKGFMKRFESLPRVSEYLKSDRCTKVAIFFVSAAWGNKPFA